MKTGFFKIFFLKIYRSQTDYSYYRNSFEYTAAVIWNELPDDFN